MTGQPEAWTAGNAYEPFIGRWSRQVADVFLAWLPSPSSATWLDLGCGTGALTEAILEAAAPRRILGIDQSPAYLAYARRRVMDRRLAFAVADVRALPVATGSADVAVSGLVLNFVPTPERALTEWRRVVRPGGVVAAYLWDYAGRMELLRRFWDAVVALDPGAASLDEGKRFPLCTPEALASLWRAADLAAVTTRAIDVPARFTDFDDLWTPFLGGQGPAPGYVATLAEGDRTALREELRRRVPVAADGSIALTVRAWAVKGERQ